MNWGLILLAVHALGMLAAVCLFTRPVRRIMGTDTQPVHADRSSEREADVIVAATVTGLAAMWPLTLSLYVVRRFIPASAEDDEPPAVEYALAQRYGSPE